VKTTVIFRANGNPAIGYGHFIRTIALAGLIKDEFRCVYATHDPTDYQRKQIKDNCHAFINLGQGDINDLEILEYLKGDEIVVIDDYNATREFQVKIRNRGCKLIYIDDHNDKHYVSDGLINNIPGFEAASFSKEVHTKLYLGIDYALLREEFMEPALREIHKSPKTIFVCFGGSDPLRITERMLHFFSNLDGYKLRVVIGDGFEKKGPLYAFTNATIFQNISAADVAGLMATSEICIITASSLLNEACSVNTKILVGYMAENQKAPYSYFVSQGLAIGLGDLNNLSQSQFNTKFVETLNNKTMIYNQRRLFSFQQRENLRNIFRQFSL
jgi:UDP-2,4-diacetamido-2,4,6-trideoxy-beta-L-altropyranose hydrolase